MVRVYDIDQALLDQQARVRLRGKLYRVADPSVADRLRQSREKQNQKAELDARVKKDSFDEEALKALERLQADAAQQLLVDLPREVAETLSEQEFLFLTEAVQDALGMPRTIEAKNVEADPETMEGTGSSSG